MTEAAGAVPCCKPMFRKRGENLHSIYVFLFLNVALYFLEHQDARRFAALFSFDRTAVAAGQWWRVLTYQFAQAGQGWGFLPKELFLFFTLLILYLMGSALEEEWGTRYFVTFFLLSAFVTAGLAAWLNVGLIGSFFVTYTLLFGYASVFPEQTFYLFAVIPIRVRWLAYITAGVLAWGALVGSNANIAVAGGALAGYAYLMFHRMPVVRLAKKQEKAEEKERTSPDFTAVQNAARFIAIRKAIAAHNDAEVERLVAQSQREIVSGVNICPPADYKPDNQDGYCIRCEGFAECSVRYMRLNRTQTAPSSTVTEASV
jgi:membrane associated rhomboid family serine protease